MSGEKENRTELICGLPMFAASDPDALEREKDELRELEQSGLARRWWGYFSKTGPGFLQSAFTLGSGTAVSSLYLGAHYQYSMLWIQPLAMIVGIVMLAAASHQTLSTCMRPFDAMRRYIHPALAWTWAIGTLVATVVWHLPQYALAAGVTEDMISVVTGWSPDGAARTLLLLAIGLAVLAVSTAITWNYGGGGRGVRFYETLLKIFIAATVIAFAVVVLRSAITGRIEWGRLFKGFLPLYIPTDQAGVTKVMAAFSAAVGINMTFLFGYTLLARGWGREHRTLARFDLVTGMLIPYAIVTTLIIVSAGCTIYGTDFAPSDITPANAGMLIAATGVGPIVGRFVFGLGMLGMALTSITLQMLVAGFAACEMFGLEPGGRNYKLACLIPAPAFLGVILWQSMGTWVALPTSAFCLLLLPIPYIGWFVLHNSSRYLGKDRPSGVRALAWNLAMLVSVLITCTSVVYLVYTKWGPLVDMIGKLL